MKLIIGLGNPGRRYENNRHNVGFMCLNSFAREHGIPFEKKQGLARIGKGVVAGVEVVLAKPQTYMNSSGESVRRLAEAYRLPAEDIFVIHDDLDLPLGKLRMRRGGSSAGHKGIQSIIECLGTADFIRIRMGISRPLVEETENGVIDYVLSGFTAEEKKTTATTIPLVGEAITTLLSEGLTAAMNKYNG